MCALCCSCPCRCWAQPQWKCIHPINLKASCNSFPCPSTAVLRLQVWPGGRPAQDPLSLWSRQLPQVDELKAIDGGSGLWPATPNTHAFLLLVSYQLICFSFVLFFSVSLPWPFCQKKSIVWHHILYDYQGKRLTAELYKVQDGTGGSDGHGEVGGD